MTTLSKGDGSRVTCPRSRTPGRGYQVSWVRAKSGHNEELNRADRWQDPASPQTIEVGQKHRCGSCPVFSFMLAVRSLAKRGVTISGMEYLIPQSFVIGGNWVVCRFIRI
jgi:hypothetical protein